ncbi:hypothetical protein [Bacillus sp. HU-1818]|uniref:hypothetical protein n=1 Tax=Bacillus sp. HU-1818 TaxID=2704469 RepID=UPI001F5D6712|nr:hypothetical protein [Bacillus sp. HU-1818]
MRHRLFRFKANFDEAGVRSGCNVRRGFVFQAQLFKSNLFCTALIILSSVVYACCLVLSGHLVHHIRGIRLNAYGMSAASIAMGCLFGGENSGGLFR